MDSKGGDSFVMNLKELHLNMEAKDLMIGDWVMDGDVAARVTSLTCDGIIETAHGISNIEVVEPIPLTPEILEKNGFKRVDEGGEICITGEYVWGNKGKRNFTAVRITFYKGLNSGVNLLTKIETDCSHESGINMIHSCDIEYAHELQHALLLCGIDKSIEL